MTESDQDLDDLLARSAPARATTPLLAAESARLARATMTPRPGKSLKGRVVAVAAGTLAALTLGVGTAFAAPIPSQWWLWSPEDDLTITTGPFSTEGTLWSDSGDTVDCVLRTRVLTDGPTATLNTVFRLYQARAFLQSVDLADYQDAAQALYVDGGDSPMPYAYDHAQMLTMAVAQEARDRGLNGQGVSIETAGLCLPPQ